MKKEMNNLFVTDDWLGLLTVNFVVRLNRVVCWIAKWQISSYILDEYCLRVFVDGYPHIAIMSKRQGSTLGEILGSCTQISS